MQAQIVEGQWAREKKKEKEEKKRGKGSYLGLANNFFVGEGMIVAVDEAEDAEEEDESSSWAGSGDGVQLSNWSSCSKSSSS